MGDTMIQTSSETTRLTDILREEHRTIEVALGALDGMARTAALGSPLPAADVRAFVAFCRSYVDGLHHLKEEELLFPALIAAGLPRDTGPLGCMLREHDLGRELVGQLGEFASGVGSGDAATLAVFARTATMLSEMLRAHIHKENHVLFVMSEEVLGDERNVALAAGLALGQTRERRARDVAGAERLSRLWSGAGLSMAPPPAVVRAAAPPALLR